MPILAKKNIFSDEAHFDLRGYVNKQNCRIWGAENPHAYFEKPTYPKRVTVWSRGIIGPFFNSVIVNSDFYRAMLNEFLFTKIEEEDIGNICFQQNGTTCHTRCFAPCFWRSHYQPQSWWHLATSELRFDTIGLLSVGCRQCYTEKPDNNREAIGEIQLHTIDNVLKN